MQKDQIDADKNGGYSVLRDIESVEAVAPGFINFKISEAKLSSQLTEVLKAGEGYGKGPNWRMEDGKSKMVVGDRRSKIENSNPSSNIQLQPPPSIFDHLSSRKIMVEFAHPNTHKAFHIGHLRNITTGESIVRLLESQGVTVVRANYQGDVGMHTAKAIYALSHLEPFKIQVKTITGLIPRVDFLGKAYAAGSAAFEADEKVKEIIKDYNYLVYAAAAKLAVERGLPDVSADYLRYIEGRKEDAKIVYELWKETRQWSLDYFDYIYNRVGTHYDRFYFESECLSGVNRAKEAVKTGILEESDGAIIFNGKKYGLESGYSSTVWVYLPTKVRN